MPSMVHKQSGPDSRYRAASRPSPGEEKRSTPRAGADWPSQGLCRQADPELLFVPGAAQNAAKAVCMSCPVRVECLADALDHRVEFGVWGGMTERERRALLRRRPNVTSWRLLLETARVEYERAAAGREVAPVAASTGVVDA